MPRASRNLLLTGLAAAGGLAYLVRVGRIGALAIVLGMAAIPLLALGLRGFMKRADQPHADYRHAYQVFGTILALLILAGVVREVLLPDSWGWYGPYRGKSVAELRAQLPRHLGKEACTTCHAKEVALHAKDAHARVQCEDCHGPAYRHVALLEKQLGKNPAPTSAARKALKLPAQAKLKKPEGKVMCLSCHLRLDARPGAFPQVVWQEHYKFVGVKDPGVSCTRCHNPHEPLFMDRDLRQARLHPVVHRCRDCHTGTARADTAERPPEHPAIFECGYCHKQVAEDFAQRSHKQVRCASCHLFFKESDFAGRIIRDADPRFCLLCHRSAPFRSDDAPPGIEWPSHREDMSSDESDATKVCVDCHRENIHIVAKRASATQAASAPAAQPAKEGSDE